VKDGTAGAAVEGLSARQAARRQRILDAALSLLELRDYERIAVRDVTEFASVALATLYH
jgi:AcrR family transcriptional regulator